MVTQKTNHPMNINTGFNTEKLRKNLLKKGNYKALLGTYFSNLPEIKDQNSPKFWDKKFSKNIGKLFPMSKDRNNIVGKLIKPKTRVLNIGSGMGYLEAVVLKNLNNNINWTGTDFTNQALQKLKKTFPKYNFLQSTIQDLPFNKNTFDTICLLEVLEHISPKQTLIVLKKINKILKKNGTAIISVPINEGLEKMLPENPNSHLRVYSKNLLTFETLVTGFKIKKIICLSAFHSHYKIKKLINRLFKIRHPNNLIFILEKTN